MKKLRPMRIEGDIAFITLTKGYIAIIDAADVGLASEGNWTARISGNTVYAARMRPGQNRRQREISLHRLLLGEPDGLVVDHIDGDGLNNRRSNLRAITAAQNTMNQRLARDNTSGFKGVSRSKCGRAWRARIRVSGRLIDLGTFDSPEAAHARYVEASAMHHGEFGRAS